MLPRTAAVRLGVLVTLVALVATLGALAPSTAQPDAGKPAATKPSKGDPRKRLGLFVDPKMPAYQQGGVYRSRIGKYAQAFWVIPEAYPTASVKDKVLEYTGDARAAHKTPVLTVYGIPGRDCGMYSSGNPLKTAAEYRGWIRQIANGLKGKHAMVIIEPDALPLFSSTVSPCSTTPDNWQGMLRYAAMRISGSGAWAYLDAGHSNWTPYDTRPTFLKQSGIGYARGFSTNVSNFRPTADEHAYARELLAGLRDLGIKGKHYVIDTSRNGATPSDNTVINPYWARVGQPPRLLFDGAFDGRLWVKHPGESDGETNGGPPSGQWCDNLADRLLDRPESGSCFD